MPTIEIDVSERIPRHLASVRLMSYMVFPDEAKLRVASEITFRTILAHWYSGVFAKHRKSAQARVIRKIGPKLGADLPSALADPTGWMRKWIFNDFLRPAGGTCNGAVALTSSPSAEELSRQWTDRWWSIGPYWKIVGFDRVNPPVSS